MYIAVLFLGAKSLNRNVPQQGNTCGNFFTLTQWTMMHPLLSFPQYPQCANKLAHRLNQFKDPAVILNSICEVK